MMDIVNRLRNGTGDDPENHWLLIEAADKIEQLRREVADLEEIMDREKCAIGYLITKRALKKFGAWNP